MKIAALISGGKDSIFSMMKALELGHNVVALVNFYPPASTDELDSFMFQTVGHELIQAIADCLELPLYRYEIKGQCVDGSLEYNETEKHKDDEVEVMYDGLKEVKEKHQIEGVCSGAILSTYQKNRVEKICSRLSLSSIAPLWQRKEVELFREMILGLSPIENRSEKKEEEEEQEDVGVLLPGESLFQVPNDVLRASQEENEKQITAIVVKVAAAGLDPKRHVGKTLRSIAPHLFKMNNMYGVSIVGEGGEFETLVVDAPIYKKRIVIDEFEIIDHSVSMFSPVGYLRVKKYHLEPKTG